MWIKVLLKQWFIMNTKMFYWIKVSDIWCIEFRLKVYNRISLSWFNDKIYTLNNEYDELGLDYRS